MISFADLQVARDKEGRLVENLESQLGCAPGEFVARLAGTLRMAAATLADLRAATPAFDLIPYAEKWLNGREWENQGLKRANTNLACDVSGS